MRPIHLATSALIATLTLAAACTSIATATPTPTPSPTPTQEPTAVVTADATPPPVTTATATIAVPPLGPQPADRGARYRTHIIDVSSGVVAALYEGNRPYRMRDRFYPTFTPDGTAIWLSIDGWFGARRFTLDGTVTLEIEAAWDVIESVDTHSRAYYLYDDGEQTTIIIAERDGASTRIEGSHALPVFSPASTELAFYKINEENSAELVVVDLTTAQRRTLATEVDPCPCDLTPHPDWSPSGDYIAYYDFAGNSGASSMGWGTFALHSDTATAELLAEHAPPGDSVGWLDPAVAPDRLVVESQEGVSLVDVRSGSERSLFQTSEDERYYSSALVAGRYIRVHSLLKDVSLTIEVTTLFDGETGDRLARWEFFGEPVMSPAGPAIAANPDQRGTLKRYLPIPCDGLLIQHPALDEAVCIDGASGMAWSPDGSTLAISRYDAGQLSILLWQPQTGLIELATLPGLRRSIAWNPQGTHLLITSGSGI